VRGEHPNSLANLVPFKPGQSGNPGGRPKGESLITLLRRVLDGDTLGGVKTEDGRTVAEHLADWIVVHAMKGNAAYAGLVLDRVCGKVGSDRPDDADAVRPIFHIIDNGRNPSPDIRASAETVTIKPDRPRPEPEPEPVPAGYHYEEAE
jgi:hypothetical protein